MELYASLDVSMATTAVCVMDTDGEVVAEFSVPSNAGELGIALTPYRDRLVLVGLEAGPMSEWITKGLLDQGFEITQMETRQVNAALSASMVKTDRNDARGIAKLLRLGWFRPVHVKSETARERRLLLSARQSLQNRLIDIDNSIRGLLRCFGLRPPRYLRGRWDAAIRELIDGHAALTNVIEPMLTVRESLYQGYIALTERVKETAHNDPVCRRLMSVPGIGPIVSLTYTATIDNPERFRSSRQVGAAAGLTPRRYQSGEMDRAGTITKCGDPMLRTALYEAANVIMVNCKSWFPLRSWAMRLAARRGPKRAKVALARKLSVILHRMWVDGTEYQARPA
ncbi:MAG: IS110 family transposase [Pseudomonadota bacterium]